MEFITTQKGGQCLLWHGCCFIVKSKMNNGTIHWRCSKRTCPAINNSGRGTVSTDQWLQLSFLSFLFFYACTSDITHLKIALIITFWDMGSSVMRIDVLGLDILGIIHFSITLKCLKICKGALIREKMGVQAFWSACRRSTLFHAFCH